MGPVGLVSVYKHTESGEECELAEVHYNEVLYAGLPRISTTVRGTLGSVVIAGGVKMKLLAIRFCWNRSMAKGA